MQRLRSGKHHTTAPIRHWSDRIQKGAQRVSENATTHTQCAPGLRLPAHDKKLVHPSQTLKRGEQIYRANLLTDMISKRLPRAARNPGKNPNPQPLESACGNDVRTDCRPLQPAGYRFPFWHSISQALSFGHRSGQLFLRIICLFARKTHFMTVENIILSRPLPAAILKG